MSWGIELPFDPNFVNYVWFDALTNYISFIGYDPTKKDWNDQPTEFRKWWPALHVIGKDIMSPAHGIYWPIMLHALGFPDEQMPKLLVHGWWNISGAKMSKSLGNVVDPDVLADKYSVEALRYYLMRDIATGADADFAETRVVERFNADLANNIGNLVNRTLNMAKRFGKERLVRSENYPDDLSAKYYPEDTPDLFIGFRQIRKVFEGLDVFLTHEAVAVTCGAATEANTFIERCAPWKLAKSAENSSELDSISLPSC